jgi:hypothetical protein
MQESVDENIAPIVVFAYNRHNHLSRVLQSIKNARLGMSSKLIVYCDGPKNEIDKESVKNVSLTLQQFDFPDIEIHVSDVNKGLARSIQDGIDEVFIHFDKAIILEDDIVLSEQALLFFNNALDLYEKDDQVMHISGFQDGVKELPDTFFSRNPSCWGWATWKSSWDNWINDPLELLQELHASGNFESLRSYPHTIIEMLYENVDGMADTWAARWHAYMHLHGGLSLQSNKTNVRNIGFDGSGENSDERQESNFDEYFDNVLFNKVKIEEHSIARRGLDKSFNAFRLTEPSFAQALLDTPIIELVSNFKRSISLATLKSNARFYGGIFYHKGSDIKVLDSIYLFAEYNNLLKEGRLDYILDTDDGEVLDFIPFEGVSCIYYNSLNFKEVNVFPQNRFYRDVLKQNVSQIDSLTVNIIEEEKSKAIDWVNKYKCVKLIRLEVTIENVNEAIEILSSPVVQNIELVIRIKYNQKDVLNTLLSSIQSSSHKYVIKEYLNVKRNLNFIYQKRGFSMLSLLMRRVN